MYPQYMAEVYALLSTVKDPFQEEFNEKVWDAMVECLLADETGDPITIHLRMKADGFEGNSLAALSELTGRVPLSSRYMYYAESLVHYAIYRRTAQVCTQFLQRPATSPAENVVSLAGNINALGKQSITDRMVPASAAQMVPGFLEYMQEVWQGRHKPMSYSGIKCLDDIVGGFEAGDIVIIGGRPSLGKTALAVNIAANNLQQNKSILFFSFEMSERQILKRLISCSGRLSLKNLEGHYAEETLRAVEHSASIIAHKPFYVAESMKPTLEAVQKVIERHVAKQGVPSLVVIDYLQLMTSIPKFDNRNQELAHISRELKNLARAMNLPMLVLCQLRRPGQGDTTKNPQLHHLRDSGAIEADADVVILLGFEAIRDAGNEVILNLSVAKNRDGGTGTCQVRFKQSIQHIQDVTWTPANEKDFEIADEEIPF